MRSLAVISTSLLIGVAVGAQAEEYKGAADRIVDGDTFWICDDVACTKIRLCGIDAPERGDAGYSEATTALSDFLSDNFVHCIQVGGGTPCDGRSAPTNGDRVVAQCMAAGEDVASKLVNAGFACDWERFSGGYYSLGDPAKLCH